jgi:hypothetical protein
MNLVIHDLKKGYRLGGTHRREGKGIEGVGEFGRKRLKAVG